MEKIEIGKWKVTCTSDRLHATVLKFINDKKIVKLVGW